MTFSSASISRIGSRRRNEDVCGTTVDGARLRAWVVADGVGGQPGGVQAAQAAVTGALTAIAAANGALHGVVRDALEAAQRAVERARDDEGGSPLMSTTIVLLASDGRDAAWGHVGDSRIYRVRDGAAELLTRDHTLAAAAAALTGGDADAPAHENQLLSSLGAGEPMYDAGEAEPLRAGDAFLLCSDGVWSHVARAAVADELNAATSLDDWLARLEQRVIAAADPQQDNYTALAVRAGTAP
jgi:serine/threonine protein phosphatase PrpC